MRSALILKLFISSKDEEEFEHKALQVIHELELRGYTPQVEDEYVITYLPDPEPDKPFGFAQGISDEHSQKAN